MRIKQSFIEIAEFRIWAYLNPLYWSVMSIIFTFFIIFSVLNYFYRSFEETYIYYSVSFARKEKVEKFIKSYRTASDKDKKYLLNKNTKAGRKLRRYTYKNIIRLKQLNKLNNE